MKMKILAIAAAVLLAAGLGGCTTRHDIYLTPKEGGASASGQMTSLANGDLRIQIYAEGKHYSGRAVCSLRDHALFKIGYFKCSAQMNAGEDTMVCEFELSTGAGSGECESSDGTTYALQVSL